MLTRIHGKIQFECDDCSEVLETDTRDFEEARQQLDGEGWRTEKAGTEWRHLCPECR